MSFRRPSEDDKQDALLSPSNQPRKSLSTHLSPDYHDWLSQVTSPPLAATPTASSTSTARQPASTASSSGHLSTASSTATGAGAAVNTPNTSSNRSSLLDAVTGRNRNSSKSNWRRENQPSFDGSTWTSRSDEEDEDEEDEDVEQEEDENQDRLNGQGKAKQQSQEKATEHQRKVFADNKEPGHTPQTMGVMALKTASDDVDFDDAPTPRGRSSSTAAPASAATDSSSATGTRPSSVADLRQPQGRSQSCSSSPSSLTSPSPSPPSLPPTVRLPPLSKSQVQVPDPSRPAFKLGQPKPRKVKNSNKASAPSTSQGRSNPIAITETSALLGGKGSAASESRPLINTNNDQCTMPPTEQRYPRYDGVAEDSAARNNKHNNNSNNNGNSNSNSSHNGDQDRQDGEGQSDEQGSDSMRRPSRARSMSPTMATPRRGRITFRTNLTNDSSSGFGFGGDHRHSSGGNRTFQQLRRSSIANIHLVREKLLSRRSGYYDDEKAALVKENNGIRIWYHNYTTIDWIHDFVKERVRLRHLRSIGGIRGMIKNGADGLKGWILVLLTGVITACLAAFIDVSSWWLGDLRMGYCTTSFWWSQYFCCWKSGDLCPQWVSWSEAMEARNLMQRFHFMSNDVFDWVIYCCFGLLFATVCVLMVTSDGVVSQQQNYGATKSRPAPPSGPPGSGSSGPLYSPMPKSPSRVTIDSVTENLAPKKIAYFGAGSGIPEVKTILGGFVIRGFLGFRTLMIKLVGLPLMVAAGLNMGKQGPLVHIACCVANIVCRIFDKYNRNDGKRREILSAAAASGVAVAFGAPIGGVLFSLEEVSYYFPSKTMWRTYFCALVSAVVLKLINPYRVGKTVLFQVTYDRDWHLFEAVPFLFISIFGGVYGALFSRFHMSYSKFRSKNWIGRHPVQEVMIVTLLTCAIQWPNPWMRVNLLQLLTNLYSECAPDDALNGMCATSIDQIYPIFLLLAEVFAIKVFLNFITFGVKVPGGIFIPTMVAGAVFGRMVGLGVQWLIATYPDYPVFEVCAGNSMDCIIPGLYAMIGAAACLAGVTRMTVSLVVIMFELTGAMTYALPIMMAVMIGKFVADFFFTDAFFNLLIELNGHPYLDNKKDYNTFGTAADIADRYLETIEVNSRNTVTSLRKKVEILAALGYADGGLPIVDHGILVGYIAWNELEHALDVAELKSKDCICIFRNRAASNVPVSEIVIPTWASDMEHGVIDTGASTIASSNGSILGGNGPMTTSPKQYQDPEAPSLSVQAATLASSSTLSSASSLATPARRSASREDIVAYDDDMIGYNKAGGSDYYQIRADDHDYSKPARGPQQYGYQSPQTFRHGAQLEDVDDDDDDVGRERQGLLHRNNRYRHGEGGADTRSYNSTNNQHLSTGTTDLLNDPLHTMDMTPFTDQAPLAVSLFSSMDLVMELFIKLGIKYVCVVKAGEHYGMIHKKRLLAFLKENEKNPNGKATFSNLKHQRANQGIV